LYRDTFFFLVTFAWLKKPTDIKESCPERGEFHQAALVTEVIQQRFSG
jgi:hypothetical protein